MQSAISYGWANCPRHLIFTVLFAGTLGAQVRNHELPVAKLFPLRQFAGPWPFCPRQRGSPALRDYFFAPVAGQFARAEPARRPDDDMGPEVCLRNSICDFARKRWRPAPLLKSSFASSSARESWISALEPACALWEQNFPAAQLINGPGENPRNWRTQPDLRSSTEKRALLITKTAPSLSSGRR